MAATGIARATEQLKTGLTESVEKIKEFSEDVKNRVESIQKDVKRGIETTQTAVKDVAQEARRKTREHPLTALAVTAGTGLALGFIVGWVTGHKRRS